MTEGWTVGGRMRWEDGPVGTGGGGKEAGTNYGRRTVPQNCNLQMDRMKDERIYRKLE